MDDGWAFGVVLLALVGSCTMASFLLGPDIAKQTNELKKKLPQAAETFENQFRQYTWGRTLLSGQSDMEDYVPKSRTILKKAGQFLSLTITAAVDIVVIVFVGLYVAWDPKPYRQGFIRLMSIAQRDRTREVLDALGDTLSRWLLGRFASMTIVGLLSSLGLWLLGVPLALTLGLIAALLTFIPNVGPLLSLIPPVLLALAQKPSLAVQVIVLYAAIQLTETYLFTPLIQRSMIALQPGLLLVAQVMLGMLLGGLGLVLATPLTAAGVALVQMLYVERLENK